MSSISDTQTRKALGYCTTLSLQLKRETSPESHRLSRENGRPVSAYKLYNKSTLIQIQLCPPLCRRSGIGWRSFPCYQFDYTRYPPSHEPHTRDPGNRTLQVAFEYVLRLSITAFRYNFPHHIPLFRVASGCASAAERHQSPFREYDADSSRPNPPSPTVLIGIPYLMSIYTI